MASRARKALLRLVAEPRVTKRSKRSQGSSTTRIRKPLTERFEHRALVRYLDGLRETVLYSHIPSGVTKLSKIEARNLRRMGLRPGVPDFLLVHRETHAVFFVELKRISGGRVSRDQKMWIAALGEHQAAVCKGYLRAKVRIKKWIKLQKKDRKEKTKNAAA